jgi:tRNA-dihydrouridine synthase B
MLIGPYRLSGRLLLAPMAGITDRPFRQLCRRYGAALAFSEMVTSIPGLQADRKTLLRCDHRGEDGLRAIQIVGADPFNMAEAARINVDRGAQIIDINMGCPAKKVCNVAAGSALLRDERLVAKILEAVVAAVSVPVTLKIRTGWNQANRNAPKVARIAESSGIRALTIHGRTRQCGFTGKAEYETMAEAKAQVNIPVIANGDIDTPEKAAQVLRATGADAVMIGRAALGRPWIFDQIESYLGSGRASPEPDIIDKQALLNEHVTMLHEFYGTPAGVRIARKHIGWYVKQHPGVPPTGLQQIYAAQEAEHQLDLVHQLFDSMPTELAA